MRETSIGLHIYALKLHYSSSRKSLSLNSTGAGALLATHTDAFIDHYSSQVDGDEGSARSWYLEPAKPDGFSHHGIIRYGASGFSEEIRDRETRKVQYNRLPTDIGTIPLYYRIWVPESGKYGLLALQTFGSRSCVSRFRGAFSKGFRKLSNNIDLTYPAIMPAEIAKFSNGEVKTISLIKHDYSSDSADNQIGRDNSLIDLDVSFRAKRRDSLGKLSAVTRKFTGASKEKALEYNNTQFDEAVAEVLVGKKRRKVVLVGVSNSAGKFDVTGDVKTKNGHPVFSSIARECEEIFASIVSG